jgi:uncharacterized protein YbaA (DUF1428 family)
MAHYVDGFVIPLPKKNLNTYRRFAQKARQGVEGSRRALIPRYGGDDLNVEMGLSFPRGIKTKPGETVLLVHRVQLARSPRSRQRKGDEGPAYVENDEVGTDAFRLGNG